MIYSPRRAFLERAVVELVYIKSTRSPIAMFEKVSRLLKYDLNIFFVHKHIYIYMDTRPDHITPARACACGVHEVFILGG